MAYIHTANASTDHYLSFDVPQLSSVLDFARTEVLTEADRDTVLDFLSVRPVHTVAMTSFILDNGMQSTLNRGTFYGSFDRSGELTGVALIGHTTLVEARTPEALRMLAIAARKHDREMHIIMSAGETAVEFFTAVRGSLAKPRQILREALFEIGFPFPVRDCPYSVRLATEGELDEVADAQADVAFIETGNDPISRDPKGFKARVLRRIHQGRVYVVVKDGKVVFKADVVSLTEDVAYLEGVWVAESHRGIGIGSSCLAEVCTKLLSKVRNVCLLSNVGFSNAHRSFLKAGMRRSDECVSVFV